MYIHIVYIVLAPNLIVSQKVIVSTLNSPYHPKNGVYCIPQTCSLLTEKGY